MLQHVTPICSDAEEYVLITDSNKLLVAMHLLLVASFLLLVVVRCLVTSMDALVSSSVDQCVSTYSYQFCFVLMSLSHRMKMFLHHSILKNVSRIIALNFFVDLSA